MSRPLIPTVMRSNRTAMVTIACILTSTLLIAAGTSNADPTPPDSVDFAHHILPILRRNCLACHSQSKAEGDVVLEHRDGLVKETAAGPIIVPGQSAESLLWKVIAGQADSVMPPEDNEVGAAKLTAEEMETIKRWIDQGAHASATTDAARFDWRPVPADRFPIVALAVAPHGRYVAAGRGSQIDVYHVPSGQLVARLTDDEIILQGKPAGVAHEDIVQSISFSPDGERFASGAYRTLRIWRRSWPITSIDWTAAGADAGIFAKNDSRHHVAFYGAQGNVWVYDCQQHRRINQWIAHPGPVAGLSLADDGQTVWTATRDGRISQWDVATGNLTGEGKLSGEVTSLAWLSGTEQLGIGTASGQVTLWKAPLRLDSTETGTPPWQAHAGPVTWIAALPPNRDTLLSAGRDGWIHQWQMSGMATGTKFQLENQEVRIAAVSPDGARLAACTDQQLRIWDIASGQTIADPAVCQHAHGELASAQRVMQVAHQHVKQAEGHLKESQDRIARENEQKKQVADELQKAQTTLAESRTKLPTAEEAQRASQQTLDGIVAQIAQRKESLATGTPASSVEAIPTSEKPADPPAPLNAEQQAAKEKEIQDLEAQAEVARKALEEKTKMVADANSAIMTAEREVAAAERTLKRADELIGEAQQNAASAQEALTARQRLVEQAQQQVNQAQDQLRSQRVAALTFSATGNQLILVTQNGHLHSYSREGIPWETWGQIATQTGCLVASAEDTLQAISARGSRLIGLQPTWRLERRIGDVNDGGIVADRVLTLDFSSDGKFIATGGGEPSRNGELKIWRIDDGTLARSWESPHSDTVLAVRYSPDGRRLASAGADRFAKVFDVESGKLLQTCEGHTNYVQGVSWRADGTLLATAGADQAVKLWDPETGEQKNTIAGFTKEVNDVEYLGIDEQIAVGTAVGEVSARGADGNVQTRYEGGNGCVHTISSASDGSIVAAAGQDRMVRIWSKDGKLMAEFK